MGNPPIMAAGREIPNALERIRRYCGLPWSGGGAETWAWPYYDAIPAEHDDVVSPVDVVCAAALHPRLSRDDLAFFRQCAATLSEWLHEVPAGPRLWEVSETTVTHLATLPETAPPSLSLLSKVLHRKRPHVIPLIDRHIIDWYRPVTGKRAAADAWAPLIHAMRAEESAEDCRLMMSIAISGIEQELWPGVSADDRPQLSWLRAADIGIWMGSR